MSKVICIVQARMNSTRLPGKTLMSLGNKTVIDHVLDRLSQSQKIDKLVVATTDLEADDQIVSYLKERGTDCVRGSADDVLSRYLKCLEQYPEYDTVVRITADCPLIDPAVVDAVIDKYNQTDSDYVTNVIGLTFPDGMDTEVFSRSALIRADQETTKNADREHVTLYIRESGNFKVDDIKSDGDYGSYRLTIDNQEDYEVMEYLIKQNPNGSHLEYVQLLDQNPAIRQKNAHIDTNEGLAKSLAQDNMFAQSNQLKAEVEKIIPLASQTFSKSYLQYIKNNAPLFITHAQGAEVWDVDGNKYIDFINGLLPVILGYQYPTVDQAIKEQLTKGIVFSLPSPLEYELAQMLVEEIPCAEMVRFGKNGSDVTTGAIRLARAVTGKDHVVICGYHGWHDWCIGTTSRNQGIPQATKDLSHTFEYNNIDSLKQVLTQHECAAVIMEPVNYIEPEPGFLEAVKELAHQHGALLIFDEVITGFRFSMGGAQKYYGVTPDLATFGKSMANGMPISALVGKKEYMQKIEDIFYSFTFGGETLSIAAAIATIKELKEKNVIDNIWQKGQYLIDKTNQIIRANNLESVIKVKGLPCWHLLDIADVDDVTSFEIKSFMQQEILKQGILWFGQHNISYSHTQEQLDTLIIAYSKVMAELKQLLDSKQLKSKLQGEPITNIFEIR